MNNGRIPLSRIFLNFTRVNKIEAMYKWPRVKVKVERGSTLTCTRGLSYIASLRSLISTDAFFATHVNARKF